MNKKAMKDDWVQRLRSPEAQKEAITDLVRRLTGGLVISTCGHGSGVRAEEVAQQAVTQVLSSLDDFQGTSSFLTWAMTIANRIAVSERRRKQHQDVSLEDLTHGEGVAIDLAMKNEATPQQPNREVIEQRLKEIVETKLTKRQQLVMRSLLEGMPIEEVAKRLDSNRNAIYRLFHEARTTMKAGFEQAGHHTDEIAAALT